MLDLSKMTFVFQSESKDTIVTVRFIRWKRYLERQKIKECQKWLSQDITSVIKVLRWDSDAEAFIILPTVIPTKILSTLGQIPRPNAKPSKEQRPKVWVVKWNLLAFNLFSVCASLLLRIRFISRFADPFFSFLSFSFLTSLHFFLISNTIDLYNSHSYSQITSFF